MRLLIAVLSIITSQILYAEVIDGPANVRTSPDGNVILSLNNEVNVSITGITGNWYKIIVFGYVDSDDFIRDQVKKSALLRDKFGRQIGKFINSFSILDYIEEESRVGVNIELYTYKSNIVAESIIEDQIVLLINKGQFKKQGLLGLEYSKFIVWNHVSGFDSVIMYDNDFSPMSPSVRLLVFFEGDSVVAIAGNQMLKRLEFDFLATKEIGRELILFYLSPSLFAKKNDFEKSLLNTLQYAD